MRESKFQKDLVDRLEKFNAEVFHVHGQSVYQESGWPDLYVAHSKWTGWLELKVWPNKLDQIQELTLKKLAHHGVQAWCATYGVDLTGDQNATIVYNCPLHDFKYCGEWSALMDKPFVELEKLNSWVMGD